MPWRLRYLTPTACTRASSGPTTSARTGTPTSTTTASSGEVRNNRTATTAYASTLDTPTPATFIARPMVHTSAMPMVTTSPEVTRRGRAAPSRVAWVITRSAVRSAAPSRSRVIERCRMMPSPALVRPTSSTAAVQAISAASRPGRRPWSMAWDSR
nr:hypothetical protein GCM10020092_039090 [Actinoplanes digitatis]